MVLPGFDPRWDRVFALRSDAVHIELRRDDYPTLYLTSRDPLDPSPDPFPPSALQGILRDTLLGCWYEEDEQVRNPLAEELLAGELTPEVVEYLVRGGFPWDAADLSRLVGSGLLSPLDYAILLRDLAQDLDDRFPSGVTSMLDALRSGDAPLVDMLVRVFDGEWSRSPEDVAAAAVRLLSAPPGATETFVVLLRSWSGSFEGCLDAALRL